MKLPKAITNLLQSRFGIDHTILGKVAVKTLIDNRRLACDLPNATDYFEYLLATPREIELFVENLLVPETWFFRDHVLFDWLKSWLEQKRESSSFLRVLSAPCATGEEPYSIAMTFLDAKWPSEEFSICAVDLCKSFLAKAQKGHYGNSSFRGKRILKDGRYFKVIAPGNVAVKPLLKKPINFIQGNLVDPFFLINESPFNIIFLRNVLIYLSMEARKKVMANIERLLAPGGILFLGHADNILNITNKFQPTGEPGAFAYCRKIPKELIARSATLKKQHPSLKAKSFLKKYVSPKQTQKNNKKHFSHRTLKTKNETSSPTNLLEKAIQLADKGHLTKAKEGCTLFIKQHGPNADAYFLLGQIHSAESNFKKAEDAYRKAIYLDKNHSDTLFQLELLLKSQGQSGRAKLIHKRIHRLENAGKYE